MKIFKKVYFNKKENNNPFLSHNNAHNKNLKPAGQKVLDDALMWNK